MIPVSLHLRNFMCYREGLPPLEFDFRLACLSGPNGAGKSALLDAITWALWGQARARSDDALIAQGAQEMEVEFEFLLEGNHYRVYRRRESGGPRGAGKTRLELQVYSPLGWKTMSGESVRQTEQRIVELLRMDYTTFINSSFLLQGRADEFTLKPPAERKRILADILGLGYYDVLEQRARERLRDEEKNFQALSLSIAELERELARREELEEALARAEEEVARDEALLSLRQKELAEIQARLTSLEADARQAEEVRRRLARLEEEGARLEERMAQTESRLQEDRALLAREAEIEAGFRRLQELRERNEALSQAAGRILSLSERQHALEQAIERARTDLVMEREVLRRSLQEMDERLEERPAIESRLEEIARKLAALREKEAQRNALLEEAQEQVAAIRALKADCQRLREEMEALRQKLDMLGEEVTHCPLCQNLLSPESYAHIRSSYQAEGEQKRDQYRQKETEIRRREEALAELRGRQETLEQELRQVRLFEGQQAALEKSRMELARLAEERPARESRLRELERALEEAAYASEERAALLSLQREIASLDYRREEHQAVQQELARLKAVEEEYHRLQGVRERLSEGERQQEELRAARKRCQEELALEGERLSALEDRLAELEALRARREEAETALREAQEALGRARQAQGSARGALERLQEVQERHRERKRACEETLERRGIYEELTLALGKRGVQAMLIETAVPEIEREANELLARMTDGEMAVQLAMQRETKQGTVVETLDINVSDSRGTRPYENFSGGEKLRINLALRIALSRLLSRRAGASLQTLVIDEGFGTQDAEGRLRLVEAIQSVEKEFERILVITHLQELKDLFPVRIEIAKTPEGSRWTVV
ncbi:MAG: AAA family ATPase [Chloroflexia bacterium]